MCSPFSFFEDLEQLKKKLADLEETLKETEQTPAAEPGQTAAEKDEDKRSIFVGNVREFSEKHQIHDVTIHVGSF